MSTLVCPVVKIKVDNHPNADTLDVITALGYQCIAKKGRFNTNDLAVYIPEGALVPENVLKEQGFWNESKNQGILTGKHFNRVKALSLRGIISQGILFSLPNSSLKEGDDLTEYFGITKYVPEVPQGFDGAIEYAPEFICPFDVEDIKKYPDFNFKSFEDYIITEKLHGTFTAFSYIKGKGWRVYCKGLGHKGFVFVNNDENKKKNIYVRMLYNTLLNHPKQLDIFEKILEEQCSQTILLGEIYGKGVQDLTYDSDVPKFRLFAVLYKTYRSRTFRKLSDFYTFCQNEKLGIIFDSVPILHTGPVTKELIQNLTEGLSTLGEKHIREGVVISAVNSDTKLPNELDKFLFLKSINPKYLLRTNGTEYN